MKVLQLGVGSVGEVTARIVAAEPAVEAVVLADLDETRCAEVGGLIGPKASPLVLDANDGDALARALAGVDLVINALIPRFNLTVMEACLQTGTHYLDLAAGGPRDVVGTADVDEEIALDARFRDKGLAALVFFGIDPGASDAFARMGAQGTGYQTGVPAAAAATLLAQGRITERGVLAPERLDPMMFLAEMTRLGCPWQVTDLDQQAVEPLLAVL